MSFQSYSSTTVGFRQLSPMGKTQLAGSTCPSFLTSPSRRVRPMRSRYSPIGTAYLRVVPRRSRRSAMVMVEPSARRSRDLAAELGVDVEVEVEPDRDLDELLLVAQQGQQLGDDGGAAPGRRRPARRPRAGSCPPCGSTPGARS